MKVYQAIQAVAAEIAQSGIGKKRENKQQGYAFRGIDEVLNALAPLLPKHGLVIVPRMLTRECVERQTAKGNPLFTVTVEAEFDFIATEDGSKHTARTFGEAMDTADKATNKAMSVAYKYAAFLTLCIPVEGMAEDADTITHELAAQKPQAPLGYDAWIEAMDKAAELGVEAMREAWKQGNARQHAYMQKHDADMLTVLQDKAAEAAKHAASAA